MTSNETARLHEVYNFLQLDIEGIQELKDIVELAAKLCETPISLITLLDENTNWIKASWGVDETQSSKEISFCQYAIENDDILVIPDAMADDRFKTNPLVQESPGLRFYAGVPLTIKSGFKLGTLCVFDLKPNELTETQKQVLSILSRQVIYILELQMTKQNLITQIQEVESKNKALRSIAQLQSHEIRGPLSSIVGLVNLAKEGYCKVDNDWIEMISSVTKILDNKIKAIVNEASGDTDFKLLKFNKVVEDIEDYAILLLDKNGNIENWNVGAQKTIGYTSEEIIGKNFGDFFNLEEQVKNIPQQFLDVANKTKFYRDTCWIKRKDNTTLWANLVINNIQNDNSDLIGFLVVIRDLSAINEVKTSLDLSEERNNRIIDEIEDYAIILLDTEGNIERWNKGAERIKGYRADEIIGRHFSIFYPATDNARDFPNSFLNDARHLGRATHEGWRVRKDKTQFWGSVVITAIHDRNGIVIGYVKITRDIERHEFSSVSSVG